MAVKLMHYWTIIPSTNDEYNSFILKKFIPGVNRLGLHTVAGWSVLVGSYSEVIMETVTNDLDQMETALKSVEYRRLKSELLNLVKQYKTKVLVPVHKGQQYSTDLSEDTVKFNQVWDVVTREENDYQKYARFVNDEFFPVMEEIGVRIAGEWEVLIGDGPRTVCEGRVNDVPSLISALQSPKLRQAKKRLKMYVENCESRILSFHVRKLKGYKSESYQIIDE